MSFDRYGSDILADAASRAVHAQPHPADKGLVVEEVMTRWCGEIVRVDRDLRTLDLEDRHGKRRTFPLGPGFLLDGRPVILHAPVRTGPAVATRTASGSVAVHTEARVARAGRIYVEGRHDAELVERVWGADLRVEGVVVEYLDGIDDLSRVVADFGPAPGRRLGMLADHLVRGSKESRIAATVMNGPHQANVLVVGHPYVDIWQAVKPARLGITAWPTIPHGMDWKTGVCTSLGWPARTQTDIARAWQRILGTVRSYADLEPAVLGRVEELIDFVTAD